VVSNAVRDQKDLAWLFPTFVICVGFEGFLSAKMYAQGVYRARGTFDHSNTLGMYLNMLLPIVFSALLNLKKKPTWLYLSIFGLGTATVILTLSRGSWVALFLSLAIVTPLSFALKFRPQKLVILGIMTALAIPPGVIAVQKMIKRVQEAPESSGEARVTFNAVARLMAKDRTFGVGINNYSYGSDDPYSAPFEGGLDKGGICHNLYYLHVGELGWGGLVVLLLLHLSIYFRLLSFLARHLSEDLRSVFAVGWLGGMLTVSFQSTLEWAMVQTAMSFTFFALAGIASALPRIEAADEGPRKKSVRRPAVISRARSIPGAAPQKGAFACQTC
jgi:hypothetical protein